MSHVLDLRFGLRLYTYIYWSTSTMSHRRMSYTASEKLAIVKYVEAHSNRAAGRQYDGVSEFHIRLWRQLKERLILPCVLYTCTLILPMTRRPQSTCALYTSAHYNRDNTVAINVTSSHRAPIENSSLNSLTKPLRTSWMHLRQCQTVYCKLVLLITQQSVIE